MRLNRYFSRIGLRLTEMQNLKLYWLGMYYNLLLPGGIGGDAYKVVLLRRHDQVRTKDLVLATLTDRAMGMLALLVLALILATFVDFKGYPTGWLPALIPVFLGLAYATLRLIKPAFLVEFPAGLGLSLLVQGMQLVAVLVLLQMLGQAPPWLPFLLLFLVSSVLTALPISYGGAGAREIAFLFGAGTLGLPEPVAVAVSLLFYVASLGVSLTGMYFSFRPLDLDPH